MVIDHNTGLHMYGTVHSRALSTRAATRKCVQQEPLEEKESSIAMARKIYSLLILAGATTVVLHSSSLSHHDPCSYKQQTCFVISREKAISES
jgi:hypothetical protein